MNNINNTTFSNIIISLDSSFPEKVISSSFAVFVILTQNLIFLPESSFTSLLPELITTRDRTIPTDFVMPIIDRENRVGLPSPDNHNRFSNLCLADFDINSSELASWEKFSKGIFKYGFTKTLLQGKKIAMPGEKTFFSIPIQETEQSIFNYVAVLDETADKKDTVLNFLNILYEQFQVGVFCDHVVVVGDGKSYDLVIKLKAEYGAALNWVLPYPGDWHILKMCCPFLLNYTLMQV